MHLLYFNKADVYVMSLFLTDVLSVNPCFISICILWLQLIIFIILLLFISSIIADNYTKPK